MCVNREELFETLEGLSDAQLRLVSDYAISLKRDEVLDMESFNFVVDNFDETLKGLVER